MTTSPYETSNGYARLKQLLDDGQFFKQTIYL